MNSGSSCPGSVQASYECLIGETYWRAYSSDGTTAVASWYLFPHYRRVSRSPSIRGTTRKICQSNLKALRQPLVAGVGAVENPEPMASSTESSSNTLCETKGFKIENHHMSVKLKGEPCHRRGTHSFCCRWSSILSYKWHKKVADDARVLEPSKSIV